MKIQNSKGVALVAVLAILVVLTILAASFSVMMDLELKQSNEQKTSYQLDMLVNAGLEHAKTILTVGTLKSNSGDAIASFVDKFADGSKDKTKNKRQYTKWMYVKDKSGKVCGRYRIRVEDEAAKVNISKAHLLRDGKGTSWDTGEINLPRSLGLPTKFAKKIVRYRYGANWLPGGRNDDDQNNVVLMADGIDNDADGQIDEEDEGINDPKEYVPDNLKGDDRKFTTMSEALSILLASNSKKPLSFNIQNAIRRDVPRRTTVYSYDKTGSPTLQNEDPSDINCMTARECRKRITAANRKNVFEANSTKRTQLAANIVDYRDENHVLSTLGSTYGVEAVCFNEVMANDESYTINPDLGARPGGDPGLGMVKTLKGNPFWKTQYGSADNKRMIYRVDLVYDCVPDDPVSPSGEYYYNLDPRKGWRIRNDEEGNKIGDLNIKSRRITFGKYLGKYGNSRLSIEPYEKSPQPADLPGANKGKAWCRWPNPGARVHVFGQQRDYEEFYEAMMNVMKKIGMAKGDKPDFPSDYFKNSLAMIYGWQRDGNPAAIGCFKITGGDETTITIAKQDEYDNTKTFEKQLSDANMDESNHDLSVTINSWGNRSQFAMVPEANVTYLMRSREPKAGRYFQIVIGRPPQGRYVSRSSYPNKLGVSGKVDGPYTEDKNNLKRHWLYQEGIPQRTKQGGWIGIMLKSDPGISREDQNRQWIGYLRMVAPEVTEMYNASATPVSLANWRVICNTGSVATEIGRIKSTICYDKILHKNIVDNNPVVHPGDHFYLVNNTELFDYWYGSGNGKWGGGLRETIPVFQMDEENWGVSYKVKKAKVVYPGDDITFDRAGYSIILKEQNLDEETFNLETIKFLDRKEARNIHSWNNIIAPVLSEAVNKKNEIFIAPIGSDSAIREILKTSVMILGLPHAGGIVSLTLKNEYEQICARTVDYGKVEVREIGKSCEKIDPTKNTWIKRRNASIGGYNKLALNRAMKSRKNNKFFIKNGPYCSIGELMHVSSGGDFERVGGGGNISKGATALAGIADAMCSSHVRLESCAGNVSRIGWKQAEDEVENSTKSTVACKNGNWKVNQWKGQTLRFLTGKLRGEKFPIYENTKNVISVGNKKSIDPTYSVPNRKTLSPEKGDKFSLGPGYASAFCFTKTGGEEGQWTWKNALPTADIGNSGYNLYIHGLNDAIDTTEFFEENNNASLNVEVWNWKTKKFDKLKKRGKYNKQDSFNAGKIKPNHISDSGDFRIKLIAYDIAEKNLEYKNKKDEPKLDTGGRQTGIAWFNYAMITPVPVPGRVNINTASARMLASLPGISTKLARNIAAGINSEGKAKLKPYRSIGEIFKVRGMTPETFERCANLLALDSSTYTIDIEAEALKISPALKGGTGEVALNQKISPEEIAGMRRKRFVVELDKAADGYAKIHELEQYSP